MDRHPFQGHIVAIGSYDGMLSVYDMRRAETPMTVLAGPESCLNQIRFHPNKADHVFTVSESGAIWHWAPPRTLTPLTSMIIINKMSIKLTLTVFPYSCHNKRLVKW